MHCYWEKVWSVWFVGATWIRLKRVLVLEIDFAVYVKPSMCKHRLVCLEDKSDYTQDIYYYNIPSQLYEGWFPIKMSSVKCCLRVAVVASNHLVLVALFCFRKIFYDLLHFKIGSFDTWKHDFPGSKIKNQNPLLTRIDAIASHEDDP